MNKGIQDILQEVFPSEPQQEHGVRLTILYQVLLETVKAGDTDQIYDEIIELERSMAEGTRISIKRFLTPTAEDVLQEFSGMAFECAMKKYKTGKDILLAYYQNGIFDEICRNEEIISAEVKERCARLISETIMDFKYAAGITDCTSLRMHAIMM